MPLTGPPVPTPAPQTVVEAAVVTPAAGPPSQEPPRPIVLQNALVGAGTTALTNVMSTGLTGDADLFKFGVVCNVFAQIVKQIKGFNEKLWTLPLMVVVGVCFCVWYFRDPARCCDLTHPFWEGYFDISPKGVLDGITAAFQAASNYHGMAATGVSPMPPTPFARSVEGRQGAIV